MVMSGKTKEEIETIIKNNTYQGNIKIVEVHKLEKSKCLTYQTHYQHNISSLFIYQDILDGCLKKVVEKLGSETVGRYFKFFESHLEEMCGYKLDSKTKNELEEAILETRVMPSMRCLMTAGEALKKENIGGYNCSYVAVDRVTV